MWPGYDHNCIDWQQAAGFEVVRFDGVHDPDRAYALFLRGAEQLGIFSQYGEPRKRTIGGVECVTYVGRYAAGGNAYWGNINLIPTRNDIVAVNFAASAATADAAAGTFERMLATVRVAK